MSSAESILRAACVAADAVASMFGRDCEVAVHDLRNPTHSLVHLANGHVTGRVIGSPIRDLILRVIPSLEEGENVLGGYRTVLDNGARLKSTTAVIRDDDGTPVVAFCINYDTNRLDKAMVAIGELTGVSDAGAEQADLQVPFDDAAGILETLVENVIREFDVDPARLTKDERLQIVEFLEAKGAFRLKGAVALVAGRLGVSEPTVYRYINQVQEKETTTPVLTESRSPTGRRAPAHSTQGGRNDG